MTGQPLAHTLDAALSDDGTSRLADLGHPMAILIDGQVAAAPILRSPIDTAALISGDYTQAEAEQIASGITTR